MACSITTTAGLARRNAYRHLGTRRVILRLMHAVGLAAYRLQTRVSRRNRRETIRSIPNRDQFRAIGVRHDLSCSGTHQRSRKTGELADRRGAFDGTPGSNSDRTSPLVTDRLKAARVLPTARKRRGTLRGCFTCETLRYRAKGLRGGEPYRGENHEHQSDAPQPYLSTPSLSPPHHIVQDFTRFLATA